MRGRRLSLLAVMVLSATASFADANSKSVPAPALTNGIGTSEVFAGYSMIRPDTRFTYFLPGGNLAYTYFFRPRIGLTTDIDVNAKPDFDLVSSSVRFGPRINITNGRIVTFVHGLVGYNYFQVHGEWQSTQQHPGLPLAVQHGLTYDGGGGIDVNVSNAWSVRPIQADALFMREIHDQFGTNEGSLWLRLSFGVVYRFGGAR